MNWKEIKENYPKSFDLLDKVVDIHWELEPERYQRLRFLYDFFDEQGIYINVSKEWYSADSGDFIFEDFFYEIVSKDYYYDCNPKIIIKTRTEAEEQAFLKAFEILEDRI